MSPRSERANEYGSTYGGLGKSRYGKVYEIVYGKCLYGRLRGFLSKPIARRRPISTPQRLRRPLSTDFFGDLFFFYGLGNRRKKGGRPRTQPIFYPSKKLAKVDQKQMGIPATKLTKIHCSHGRFPIVRYFFRPPNFSQTSNEPQATHQCKKESPNSV